MLLEHLTVSGSREEFRRDGVGLMGLGSQPGAAKKVKKKQNSGIFSKVFAPNIYYLQRENNDGRWRNLADILPHPCGQWQSHQWWDMRTSCIPNKRPWEGTCHLFHIPSNTSPKSSHEKNNRWAQTEEESMKYLMHFLKKCQSWNFLGGPVVKTLHFQCRGLGFDLWSWSQDLTCHAAPPKSFLKEKCQGQ